MYTSVDFYLGIFLVLSGFSMSVLNLVSITKRNNKFSPILLSENILIVSIGVGFLCRAAYSLHSFSMSMEELEDMSRHFPSHEEAIKCGFSSLLLSYGPLVLSLVNSFMSLIVNSYMHYQTLMDEKRRDEENIVENFTDTTTITARKIKLLNVFTFLKTNISCITIFLQWLLPIIMTLFLYPMNVQEVSMSEMRQFKQNECVALLDFTKHQCSPTNNESIELHKYISPPINYTDMYEQDFDSNKSAEIDFVLNNVFKILTNYNNNTDFSYTKMNKSTRTPKMDDNCMKLCLSDNKSVLLYMFILTVISFFVPITISMIILTKIHMMNVRMVKVKKYVTKDVLYNILFWSPVMFDTFLSLILCSFSMQGPRTSIFSVVANTYQVIKNFLNTKHFNENIIVPE